MVEMDITWSNYGQLTQATINLIACFGTVGQASQFPEHSIMTISAVLHFSLLLYMFVQISSFRNLKGFTGDFI